MPSTGSSRDDPDLTITTASGSTYLLSAGKDRLCRVPPMDAGLREGAARLRRDLDWVTVIEVVRLEVGEPAVFAIEPLGDPASCAYTTRTTTPVVEIRTDSNKVEVTR